MMRVNPLNIAEMQHDSRVRRDGIGKSFGDFLRQHQWRLEDAAGQPCGKAATFDNLLATSTLTEGDKVVCPNGVKLHISAVIILAGSRK